MICKTNQERIELLKQALKDDHPYDCPELLVLSVCISFLYKYKHLYVGIGWQSILFGLDYKELSVTAIDNVLHDP